MKKNGNKKNVHFVCIIIDTIIYKKQKKPKNYLLKQKRILQQLFLFVNKKKYLDKIWTKNNKLLLKKLKIIWTFPSKIDKLPHSANT